MKKLVKILAYLNLLVGWGWGYYFAYQGWFFDGGKSDFGLASFLTLVWGAMGFGIWCAIWHEIREAS